MKQILSVRNLFVVGLIFSLTGCVTKPPAENHARSETHARGTDRSRDPGTDAGTNQIQQALPHDHQH